MDLDAVEAMKFCQAVNGEYRERPNDPGARESPASVDVSYNYFLETNPDATLEDPTALDPENVVVTLQQRLADALVFTLFDDCQSTSELILMCD